MAANEYYHANIPNPPSYDQVTGGHTGNPSQLNTNTPGYGFQGHSPVSSNSHHDDPSAPYHNRESQHSLQSDGGAYATAGRVADGDHYAENIPLKAQTQFGNNPEWMHQPTQYPPPSPGALEDRRRRDDRNKKGFFRKKPAWVTWTLTLAQIIVFIVELVKNGTLTGSPIETKPSFNVMIGPSPYVQIYMGARYDPCMKNIPGVQNSTVRIDWPCPNTTSSTGYDCSLSDLCGFGGVPNPKVGGSLDDKPEPNQWFRFIVPIFLHGGFIHIGFNLLVQLTMGADMERMIGMWRYTLTYFASGIFGYVFGGNYASQLQPSTGCSGALFGIMALTLLELLYDWPQRESPWIELLIMVFGVAVSFVLGLLPGLDNFSHIGGFIMGLAMGLSLLRSPNALRERIGLARQPYVAMSGGAGADPADKRKTTSMMDFFKGKGNMVSSSGGEGEAKGPLHFFKGRKPLWWAWWLVRAGALVAVLVAFIMLIVDFYKYPSSNCSWCYRLSCLPVNGWCKQDTLQTSETTTSN